MKDRNGTGNRPGEQRRRKSVVDALPRRQVLFEKLHRDEEVTKLLSGCLPEQSSAFNTPIKSQSANVTPRASHRVQTPVTFPRKTLTCVKEELKESELTQVESCNNSPPQPLLKTPKLFSNGGSTEEKGFYVVRQPSLVSTGP